MAFFYEYSYQGYYKLPIVFIDLNITTLTRSLSYTLLAALVIFSILNTIVYFISFKLKIDTLWKRVTILVFLISILIFGAFKLGEFKASTKEEYMILKLKEELFVVVTSYSGNLIIAPLDIKTETMSPEFQAIEIKSMKDTQIITFENGLNVKELKSSKELKKEQLN
ncbi:hypothetical protein [Solibacillus daqui]|uniref:hypothetical protein n=1 Tax=Solibacillus daqui TaxID=2912187 RepID=UPI0023661F0A|nr:hypothetical protein [Solibacillus daqui]